MFKQRAALTMLWVVLGFTVLSALPASANVLYSATATANCQGYALTAVAQDLIVGQTYTLNYNFTLTCNGGSAVNVPGTITFTAAKKRQTVTASGSFPGLSGSCVVTGTAMVVGHNTVTILINGVKSAPLSCVGSPTANCVTIVAEQGVAIIPVTLTATGGSGAPYTFTATGLPAGLSISSTGTISGTPTVNGTFSYTVTITDSAGNQGTINCSVTVAPPLSVTCQTNNVGEVGVPYNSGPMTVTGGVAPYTFSIGSGTLPAGLTLNTSTGAITGTPTAPGTFTVKVTDAAGNVGTSCTITVNPGLSVSCSATTKGIVGQPFNSGPITVTGGTAPYTFSIVGTLPAGLTLNTSTGAVTGTPTTAGSFSIQVTDADGAIGSPACPITISTAPCLTSQLGPAAGFSILGLQNANIQLAGKLSMQGNVGIGANGQINVNSGQNFPGTLYADPSAKVEIYKGGGFSGGVVTQSMAAIQSAVAAEVASVSSLSPTQTFGQINSATTVTGNGGQNVIQVNNGINLWGQNLTISGGANDTFFFNIAGGLGLYGANIVLNGVSPSQILFLLPGWGNNLEADSSNTEGVFIVPQGNIKIAGGTHTSEFIGGGTISFGGQCHNNSNTTINALPACSPEQLTLSCPANSGVVGEPYSSALLATGGVVPYTFSITGGSLPTGLNLNASNGDITGTPTAAEPYTFNAQVHGFLRLSFGNGRPELHDHGDAVRVQLHDFAFRLTMRQQRNMV